MEGKPFGAAADHIGRTPGPFRQHGAKPSAVGDQVDCLQHGLPIAKAQVDLHLLGRIDFLLGAFHRHRQRKAQRVGIHAQFVAAQVGLK